MYFDALTMEAVTLELQQKLLGGRVQRVVQTSPLSLGLEVYAQRQRFQLLASAHPAYARVHLTAAKPTRDPQASGPILLHLRRRVRGAFLEEISSPFLERILFLRFRHRRLPADEQRNTLVVEVMGRHSNLILLDQNEVVLECVKRVTPDMSSVRPMLPQRAYQMPPRQVKTNPLQVSPESLERALSSLAPDLPLWRALRNLYRGLSPLLGREIVHRAYGQADLTVSQISDPAPLSAALIDFWSRPEEGRWTPSLAFEEGQPVAAAPYRLTHHPEWVVETLPSISSALDRYFSHQHPQSGHRQTKEVLLQLIEDREEQLQRQRSALQRELEQLDEAAVLRRKGEWLLAYQSQIHPGQTKLEVEELEIEIDPQRSPVENAQSYFDAYRKAKQAGQSLPHKIAQTEHELAWLEEVRTLLQVAESYDEITSLATELEQAGIRPPRRSSLPRRSSRLPPRSFRSSDDLTILVGRSARQNDALTRKAQPHDLWLHARGRPGAHVIVQTEGGPVPETTLQEAASLAAYYSQGREEKSVPVDLTECRHVRRISGGKPGMVRYSGERTLTVPPQRPEQADGST